MVSGEEPVISIPLSQLLAEIKSMIQNVDTKMDLRHTEYDRRLTALETEQVAQKRVADNQKFLLGICFSIATLINVIVNIAFRWMV